MQLFFLVDEGETISEHYQTKRKCVKTSGADLCKALGGIICNFTPILLYFKHWGVEARALFFYISKLSEDQKQRSSPKIEEFLTLKSSDGQKSPKTIHRSDADHSQIIGEWMQMQIIVKLLGECNQYIGKIYPPGFCHPWSKLFQMTDYSCSCQGSGFVSTC